MSKIATPFRYPGAKSRIASVLVNHMEAYIDKQVVFVEPFVGGGSVFIEVLNRLVIRRLVVNDLDDGVASFWSCIRDASLCGRLIYKIVTTPVTVEEHKTQREKLKDGDIVERAFACLFLNRTSFSGILTSGPIGGYKQKSKYSVDCRYNAEVIAGRVQELHCCLMGRVESFNLDFQEFLTRHDEKDCVIYCDAPYYIKGNQLYRHGMAHEDHVRLSAAIRSIRHARCFLSYDYAEEIVAMYEGWSRLDTIPVRYSISGGGRDSWNRSEELLISHIP